MLYRRTQTDASSYLGGNYLSVEMTLYLPYAFNSALGVPLPNLGFSLVGFTRSTSLVSDRHRHCGTFKGTHTISYDLGIFPAVSQET